MAGVTLRGYTRYWTDGKGVYEGTRTIPARLDGDYNLLPDGENFKLDVVKKEKALSGNPAPKKKSVKKGGAEE